VDCFLDEGTFREYDMLKAHRCTEFGMENQEFPGINMKPFRARRLKWHGRRNCSRTVETVLTLVVPCSSTLGDGVITGHGMVNGRLVYIFSQDFTV
jgi:propionyl-CoA carboxylase beta chain